MQRNGEDRGYMADLFNQVFTPSSFQELFSAWNRFPDALLYAGGTGFLRNLGKRIPSLPKNIISLDKMEELQAVSRTERYLEIGAMVKLSQIIQLGRIVPEVLTRCIENIACPEIRNQATIGGNLCHPPYRLDCTAPMIALDAQYELRTSQSYRWISASRFSSLPGPPALMPEEILTKIRIPLEPWDFTWYRKFQIPGSNEAGAGILFIIKTQKNILTDIKVIYSGYTILREKNSESMLKDKHLPLEKRDAMLFLDRWKHYLSIYEGNEDFIFTGKYGNTSPELIKAQILNFIETTLQHISD